MVELPLVFSLTQASSLKSIAPLSCPIGYTLHDLSGSSGPSAVSLWSPFEGHSPLSVYCIARRKDRRHLTCIRRDAKTWFKNGRRELLSKAFGVHGSCNLIALLPTYLSRAAGEFRVDRFSSWISKICINKSAIRLFPWKITLEQSPHHELMTIRSQGTQSRPHMSRHLHTVQPAPDLGTRCQQRNNGPQPRDSNAVTVGERPWQALAIAFTTLTHCCCDPRSSYPHSPSIGLCRLSSQPTLAVNPGTANFQTHSADSGQWAVRWFFSLLSWAAFFYSQPSDGTVCRFSSPDTTSSILTDSYCNVQKQSKMKKHKRRQQNRRTYVF